MPIRAMADLRVTLRAPDGRPAHSGRSAQRSAGVRPEPLHERADDGDVLVAEPRVREADEVLREESREGELRPGAPGLFECEGEVLALDGSTPRFVVNRAVLEGDAWRDRLAGAGR